MVLQVHVFNLLITQCWQNPLLCYNSAKWETLLEDPSSFLGRIGLLGWVTDRSDGCPAIQRDLSRLEGWANTSLMKLNNGKWQVLPQGRNNTVQPTSWKVSWQKRTGTPGEYQADHAMCHVPLWQSRPTACGSTLGRASSSTDGGRWSFPSAQP